MSITHDTRHFYIGGAWIKPVAGIPHAVINPANGQQAGTILLGTTADVDIAVAAARKAFETYSQISVTERIALLERIAAVYERRSGEMAATISREMGAPISIARGSHAPQALCHLREALSYLRDYPFAAWRKSGCIVREPIGVCAMITPWNWPMNQISCKVVPALAAGCTMVLKPSELAPLNAHLFAEILNEAGVPAGVFNLVDGTGPEVGEALARHPDVDMITVTGSNRAGVAVAKAAADTVKRVCQELGGKSAAILLDDIDVEDATMQLTLRVMRNSGQSCAALTRLLVPAHMHDRAIAGALAAVAEIRIGDPASETTTLGPIANEAQFGRVVHWIQRGISEGARLIAGGPDCPAGLEAGYYVKPTVFTDVRANMAIAQEEIFGPVLCIMPYASEDEAVQIANSTRYGLSGAVRSADAKRALLVARRLRIGMVHINQTLTDFGAPFGGYRQSGNGREWGTHGLEEFLETKMIFGAPKN